MHIVFMNPQGNFDPQDSYLTEHPDFGGQLVYVKELAQAMSKRGHKIDIVTRKIQDNSWPEFSSDQDGYPGFEENLRILRFSFGGDEFLKKEELWPHIPDLVNKMLQFYGKNKPDFITSHYADGGYAAKLALELAGIPFSFTGHSLGAQKLDKLAFLNSSWSSLNEQFKFSKRIAAERNSMKYAAKVFVSTEQERVDQYSHPLYQKAVDTVDDQKFEVIPPGVNETIFNQRVSATDTGQTSKLDAIPGLNKKPAILVSSRLDKKKNIEGLVKAYSESSTLRNAASLVLCVRGIDDPKRDIFNLEKEEKEVLGNIIDTIDSSNMASQVYFLNISSQFELAATYRYFARLGSVFALTSVYEPFGLAPIEAAATGLVPVVTKNGGPADIFSNGSGILIDPTCSKSIANGLMEGLNKHSELSSAAAKHVNENFSWDKTAAAYITAIDKIVSKHIKSVTIKESALDCDEEIKTYLTKRFA
ncbi:glycosyltransferase [Alphaproteobacteria bacterium]|jgi:sucrose-phosphate synthase|nr:glycosyltransferase [Alphaproteobacteria bacterium]MDC1001548.1 glycosyltransferase [Alphaproteobacteria bacterium]MDC1407405.1 glycosyltransferase [Candidatus Puniceispirillum sp.]